MNRNHKLSLRSLVHTCMGVALVLCTAGVAHAQEADPDEHYRHAVELAKTGKLTEAREEFKAAFALRPHARVSYNLAKLSLELGEKQQAISYLRTYLMFDQSRLPPEQVAEVKSTLAELEGEVRAEQPALTESPASAAPKAQAREDSATEASNTTPSEQGKSVAPPSLAVDSFRQASSARANALEPRSVQVSQLPEWALTSAGVAVLLGGVGLWFWNDADYEQAMQEHDQLALNSSSFPKDASELNQFSEHRYAAGGNAERFDAVQRMDIVAWAAIGIGAVTTATGAWLLLNSPESRVVVGSRSVGIRW